jgi:hypothetical protein
VAFLSFLVTVAFVPGWSGAALAPRWAILAIAVPFLIQASLNFTAAHLAMLLFLGWMTLSFAWTFDPLGGVQAIAQFAIIVGLFFAGARVADLRPILTGAALGIGASSIISLFQMNGWHGLAQITVPAGLFVNGNFMAEAAVLILVGVIAERMWWAVPLAAPAALLPGARGPLMALVIALTFWIRNRYVTALVLLVVACVVLASIHFGYRVGSVTQRAQIYADTISAMTFFGNGIGSFYTRFPSFASSNTLIERPDHVHNDGLEVLFEAGIGAAFLIPVFIALYRYGRGTTGGLILLAFGVESLVEFPLYLPVTAFLGAVVAGAICARGVPLRISYAQFRASVRAGRNRGAVRRPSAGREGVPVQS